MRITFIIYLLFSCLITYSQDQTGSIKGNIFDKNNNPVQYANISLLNAKDSIFVVSSVSDESGSFQFNKIEEGTYLINIRHISFVSKYIKISISQESLNLGKIQLESSEKVLDEVVVKSAKPVFMKENDRLIFNVAESIVNGVQTNVEDLLKNLPGVWFDRQNTISFRGQKNVQITINGRNIFVSLNFLKSLSATNIEKIELIYNPDAKYGAEGNAIINIVTKTNVDEGFNGTLTSIMGKSVGYDTFYPKINKGLNLSLGKRKFSIFGNYNFIFEESLRNITEKLTFPTATLNQSIKIENLPEISHNVQTGFEYNISNSQAIRLFYNKTYTDTKVKQLNNIDITQSSDKLNVTSSAKEDLIVDQDEFNFEYQNQIDSTQKINFSTDYIHFTKDHLAFYDNLADFTRQEKLRNDASTKIGVWVSKLDFSKKMNGKNLLEAGIKYSDVNTNNLVLFEELVNTNWQEDIGRSNKFTYKEQTFASYLNFTTSIKKIEIIAGLRYENSKMSGTSLTNQFRFERDFAGFFPSLSLNYVLNTDIDFGFYYSRRVKRPGYVDINPFIYYVNPFTVLEGNPNLVPSITNKWQLNMKLKQVYTASLSYYFTNDLFTTAQFQNIENKTQRLVPTNIGNLENIELNLGAAITFFPWWESYFDVSIYNQKYFENSIAALGFGVNANTTFQIYHQHTFTIPADISLELTNTLVSPSVDGQFRFSTINTFSLGAKKSFFNKKLDVKIGFVDFLKTLKYDGTLSGQGWISNFRDLKDSRQLNISLNYNFYSRGKVRDTKANWVSEDEKKRIK